MFDILEAIQQKNEPRGGSPKWRWLLKTHKTHMGLKQVRFWHRFSWVSMNMGMERVDRCFTI